MLVVRTTEYPADPIRELVSAEQSLGLRHLAFAVDPLGLYRVQPRALGGQRARYYPNPTGRCALTRRLWASIQPAHLSGFYASLRCPRSTAGPSCPSASKPLATPSEELRGYVAHLPTIHEPQPGLCHLRQIQPVAGEGLRLGIVLPGLFLEEAHRIARLDPGAQVRPLEARKPALILEAQNPLRMAPGQPDQPISSPFFRAYSGSGLSIQRLGPLPAHPKPCQRRPDGLCH